MKHVDEAHITIGKYAVLVMLAPIFLHPRHSMSRWNGWLWSKPETVALLGGWLVHGYMFYELLRWAGIFPVVSA